MKNRVFTRDIKTVYVVGDLHGDNDSFIKILSLYKKAEKDSSLIFLGDYADRGKQGVEIITKLNDLLDSHESIIALKGNHELYINEKPDFAPCNLIDEASSKYASWEKFYGEVLSQFISKLYIAAIINNILFVHGGVSSGIKSVEDLEDIKNEKILLWSDPSFIKGEHRDIRGAGVEFGEDITDKVLSSLGLKLIVRSHEPMKASKGPFAEHNGKVVTTNSCDSYGKLWNRFILKINTINLKYMPLYI
jgi:serine/threonine-protein phosphatase 5